MTDKAKRGRPRDPRQIKLQVRLSPAELEAWAKAAEAASLDLSTWVRSVANTAARKAK